MKTGEISDSCFTCSLKGSFIFKNCAKHSRKELFPNKRIFCFEKGDEILKQGDAFSGVYCVKAGVVKIVKPAKEKKDEFILWFARPGEILGLDSFIGSEKYTYSAVAMMPAVACFIPNNDFRYLLANDSTAFFDLMKTLSRRIDFIEERITSMVHKKTKERLAEFLVDLAVDEEKNKEYYGFTDIASMIGTTQSYLHKLLIELSSKNLVEVKKRYVKVKDVDRLIAISNGDYQ